MKKSIKTYVDFKSQGDNWYIYAIVDDDHRCKLTRTFHEFNLLEITGFLLEYKERLVTDPLYGHVESMVVFTDCPQLVLNREFLKKLQQEGIYLRLHSAGIGAMTKVVRKLQGLVPLPSPAPVTVQWARR